MENNSVLNIIEILLLEMANLWIAKIDYLMEK
jgi:hypothetical protein